MILVPISLTSISTYSSNPVLRRSALRSHDCGCGTANVFLHDMLFSRSPCELMCRDAREQALRVGKHHSNRKRWEHRQRLRWQSTWHALVRHLTLYLLGLEARSWSMYRYLYLMIVLLYAISARQQS